jgi:hypothetical protein
VNASELLGAAPSTSPLPFDTPARPNLANTNLPNSAQNAATGPRFPELSSGATIHNPLGDPGLPPSSGAPGDRYDSASAFPPPATNTASGRDPFAMPPVQGSPSSPGGLSAPSAPSILGSGAGQLANPLPMTGAQGGNSQAAVNPTPQAIGTNPTAPRAVAPQSAQRPASEGRNQTADDGQKPWVPLVLTLLGLIGSVSANFFLGWSYMDARQKYQSLVRKTADKFRRAAEAA